MRNAPTSAAPGTACVIGCGTGGQATAILLRRAGWRVTILERAPALSPVGAGLLLQPTGMSVLHRLGVLDRVLSLGARVDRLDGFTTSGRHIMSMAYSDLRPGLFGLGVHRGMLFQTLQREVDRCGVEVCTGVEAVGIAPSWDNDRPVPRVVVDASGVRHGPFDLVVIADGARSRLRAGCPLVTRERAYPWGAMWFVGEDRERRYDRVLSQAYRSTTGMVGFLPSGRRDEHSPPTVSMFYSVRVRDADTIRAAGLDAFRRHVLSLASSAGPLLSQVGCMDQIITASYMDVRMGRTVHGNIVVLGDAAHATSPQLGQGANLALLDAASLADHIGTHPLVPDALAAHDAQRRRSVLFYQRASRWITPAFQSDHTWIAPFRDALMGPALGVPTLRRQAVLTLAGVKAGITRSSPLPHVPGPVGAAPAAHEYSETLPVRE